MSNDSPSKSKSRSKLPQLVNAEDFGVWKKKVETHLFRQKVIVKLDSLKAATTLDGLYFKANTAFKLEYKALSKDDQNQAVDPFDDDEFVGKCLRHALRTAEGFQAWLPGAYADILDSLSPTIDEKVASVENGDLVDLIRQIKLAIQHFEIYDPDELDMQFTQMTMKKDGQQDVMLYLAKLKQIKSRLAVAGHPLRDSKAMRVLIKGINQDVFKDFIRDVNRRPYSSFDELEQALLKEAAREEVLEALANLAPGRVQTTLTTVAQSRTRSGKPFSPPTNEARLDRIERILVSMAVDPASRNRGDKRTRNGDGKARTDACYDFAAGKCRRGKDCKYAHDEGAGGQEPPSKRQRPDRGTGKWCKIHATTGHNTSECNKGKANPAILAAYAGDMEQHDQRINNLRADIRSDLNSFTLQSEHAACTRHVLALPDLNEKIDRWCIDGASTCNATFNRANCRNIRPCKVLIQHADSRSSFYAYEMGDAPVAVKHKTTGKVGEHVMENTLISEHFPFHICSEIKVFEGTKATCTKEEGEWSFFRSDGNEMFTCRQPLLHDAKSATKLYFIDEADEADKAETDDSHQREAVFVFDALPALVARSSLTPSDGDMTHTAHASAVKLTQPGPVKQPKINARKNLELLLELHVALGHRNLRSIAAQFGLYLPHPLPLCWACLVSKPKSITADKVSTRVTKRPYEGLAADAKGPFNTPTPEGFIYFFIIKCLFCDVHWVILAKSQAAWKEIWPTFVKRAEASTGTQRCVSFIITDGQLVHSQTSIKAFNDERGTRSITSAPYNQWQDPAESGVKVISQSARTSLIHGGGEESMWGDACMHAGDSINLLEPAKPVPGFEGKCRWEILNPSETRAKLLRRHKPFLQFAIARIPKKLTKSDFKPKTIMCLNLRYDSDKKAWSLLTLPNYRHFYCIDVRHITGVFPLRVTNHLNKQMYNFMNSNGEDDVFRRLGGPGNIMRRQQVITPQADSRALVERTPTEVRQPVQNDSMRGPVYSSTRGYRPSLAGLESAASVAATRSDQLFTPDDLAARTPRNTKQALQGADREYWIPGILKDHRMLRSKGCFINITTTKPFGPTPPPCEQRCKIKYRGKEPISLADLLAQAWKVRCIMRGDRLRFGDHYDATAAPVVIIPSVKMLLAWGVALGLLPFEFDESDAFYNNNTDKKGIVVQLPPGYDPDADRLRPLDAPPLYGELAKSIPGMPQGSLVHYAGMVPDLAAQGFVVTDVDPCLFVHRTKQMAVAIHVDDGVLMCASRAEAESVLGSAGLGKGRKLTWGPLSSTLGIEFEISYTPSQRTIFMHQRNYATTVLRRADMYDCNPVITPAVPGRKYTKASAPSDDEARKELARQGMTKKWYHTIVASLNFLVMITRDDMRFIQGKNAKYCADPGLDNFKALKHQLRFLKGTVDYGIEFSWRASDPEPEDGPLDIKAYSDSSFADDVDTGRTTLGTLIQINGATTSSSSKLSYRVDSCVNHSELRAFDAATVGHKPDDAVTDGACVSLLRTAREVKWTRGVKAALEKRDVAGIPPTPVYVDNAGVLSMLNDRTMKAANKHIYRTVAESREHVHLDKHVVPVKINTKDNLANALTKQEPGLRDSAAQLRLIAGPRADGGRVTA